MLGEGIIKGMAETARNFLGSYVSDERLTTIQYPEERQVLPEATRQFPFLVHDGDDWLKGMRCVACQICEKECPPKCIYIVKSKDKKPVLFFFFNDTATTEIYTLSLHDALPI